MKPLTWLGTSLDAVRAFPEEARREAGYQLMRVQEGLDPSDWKPMKSVGAGVREIRIHAGNQYRVIYVASFEESVFVLHAFGKKTRATSQRDIDLARARLKALATMRSGKR